MNERRPHIVIVGGGISGLSVAFFLSRKFSGGSSPFRITILEEAGRFGGVLKTLRPGEFSIEAAADTFEGSRPGTLDLCAELGLTAELTGSEPSLKNISIRRKHHTFLVPFSSRVLTSGVLDLPGKIRLALGSLFFRGNAGADEDFETFLRRRFGPRFWEQVVAPVIRGVMMAEPGQLSTREYFPARKGGRKSPGTAWTLRGGMDRLVIALTERLQESAVLRLHTCVRDVTRTDLWKLTLESGETLDADAVCLALPACRSAGLLRNTAPELFSALSAIRYGSVAVVNLMLRAEDVPPEGKRPGFIVPGQEECWPFSCLKWVGEEGAGSPVRAKVFIPEAFHPETYGLPDDVIIERIAAALNKTWNIPGPVWAGVERYPHALAQYGFGHRDRVRGIERMLQNFPGLYLAGNGFHGFGITDCVRSAQVAAEKISRFIL